MRLLPISRYVQFLKYRAINIINGEAIFPFYASFKITRRCTRRCPFCDCWKSKIPDLSTKEIYKIMDNLASSSIMLLSFEGGDPLVRPDILEILKYAEKKPYYFFFTTAGDLFGKHPKLKEIAKYPDYIHVSIDEGHGNLEYLDRLKEFQSYGPEITVQIVVTKNDLQNLEYKVKKIHDAGARTVIMPAVDLDLNASVKFFPGTENFKKEILRLKEKYPGTITTPDGYLERFEKMHGCASDSIIVDADGSLFYPCRVKGKKPFNLLDGKLNDFLLSPEAEEYRQEMRNCTRQCGWYQYYSTESFVSFSESLKSYYPYLKDKIKKI